MFDRPHRLPLRRTRRPKTNRPNLARTWRIIATVILIALASVYVALAAISLSTSVPYTQNFTSMGIPVANPAPSNLPADFRQDTSTAIRGVGAFFAAATTTARVGGANVPTNAANGSYNFGAGTTTLGDADRTVGFISSGTATRSGNLYAQFVNNTGSPLTGLQISYDVEKYRNKPRRLCLPTLLLIRRYQLDQRRTGLFHRFPGRRRQQWLCHRTRRNHPGHEQKARRPGSEWRQRLSRVELFSRFGIDDDQRAGARDRQHLGARHRRRTAN